VNEEVVPCPAELVDGPKPPPPPTESLIKPNTLRSNEDLLPPIPPTTELGSYSTQQLTDHMHMQESYVFHDHSELNSLRKENEELKIDISSLREKLQRLKSENIKLLNENTLLKNDCYQKAEKLAKAGLQNGMPIPEQSAGATRQEMVPKGSGTY